MKIYFTIFLSFLVLLAMAQPFQETVITGNFADPYTVKTADMDNNGYEDMVVAGVAGITWFSNTNGSQFDRTVILDSLLVSDIELIDYNFDTHPDIIGVVSSTGTIFRLMNDGSMNFTYHIISDTLVDLKKITAIDTDSDNDVDIFFSVYSGGFYNIYLYENTPGGFTSTYVDRVDFVSDIYVFDYQNDNDIDFLTKANYTPFTTEEIGIMVNDGTNIFSELIVYEGTGNVDINDAQFIDLDNNGTGDLIIADNVQDELYWLENAGSTRHNIVTTTSVSSVLVQDYNHDGIYDISYKYENSTDQFLYVLQGSNPGSSMSFTQMYNYTLGVASSDLVAIETDGDTLPEFAYTAANRDEVGFMKNDGNFAFTNQTLTSYIPEPNGMRRTDLDNDGDMDIIAYAEDEQLVWFDQQPDGTYIQKLIITGINDGIQLEAEDMNNDGFIDIITASSTDDDFSIWYNDGNENFTEFFLTSSNTELSNPLYFSIADLDNDNDKDFVIVASSTTGTYPVGIFWIRNEGGGTYSSPIAIQSNLSMMGEVVTHDFDNDGNIDIIVADGPYGATGLRTIKNNGGGSFTSTAPIPYKAECIRLGDIDNDGLMDFVTRDDANNDIKWFKNNGNFTFTENTITMSEVRDVEFEICDADNDGHTDIFFYTNYFGFTNSSNFTAGILMNDGFQNFTLTYYLENHTNLTSAIVFDDQNDNDIDFFLAYDYDDKISFYENLAIDLDDPEVTVWPSASDITYGDSLGTSVLSGGTAVASGTFAFTNPTQIPEAGICNAQVRFSPNDPLTYFSPISYVSVTVNKADQTIDWTQDITGLVLDDTLILNATATSGLTVTYSSDNPSVAVISNDTLIVVGYGMAIISASQAGNNNYNPATVVDKILDLVVNSPEAPGISEVHLYPVPASNYLMLEVPGCINFSYFISDQAGRIISEKKYISESQCNINISSFSQGTYYMHVLLNETIVIVPFMK